MWDFLINKPVGITSHDVVYKIKKKFNVKKIGHAGTLDPLATGVMVVLVNQATKISNFLLSSDKTYVVEMQLFTETDSGDKTGIVVKSEPFVKLKKQLVKSVVAKYNGYIYEQYPPIYSAVKVEGKKLYEYARSGQDVEIKPRTVTINQCNLLKFNAKTGIVKLKIACSKGTYIRSLVKDIATDLETIATVISLERTASGSFDLKETKSIEKIQTSDLISMYDGLLKNGQTLIEYHKTIDIIQGKAITLPKQNVPYVFVIDSHKAVLAIYKWVAHNLYNCQRGLWDPEILEKLSEAERDF
ncbi:tRNA pseudouridine(55) synthase TruB [Spiroplasma clarkii]|uniref:tRNA pseudouridine(55) synthase TruB n=1 Tax=Spiroplasma clarkii TaxID=2139 RepID=UPI0011BAC1B4|nr:tRNA pseudouridine(55) synthase TruB [Spiroplasma clarkii]